MQVAAWSDRPWPSGLRVPYRSRSRPMASPLVAGGGAFLWETEGWSEQRALRFLPPTSTPVAFAPDGSSLRSGTRMAP